MEQKNEVMKMTILTRLNLINTIPQSQTCHAHYCVCRGSKRTHWICHREWHLLVEVNLGNSEARGPPLAPYFSLFLSAFTPCSVLCLTRQLFGGILKSASPQCRQNHRQCQWQPHSRFTLRPKPLLIKDTYHSWVTSALLLVKDPL